jgi:hypothetical protein
VVYENAAGQIYNHYVQVPTSKLTFTVNTQKGPKESAFMFVKFKAFCAGIGEVASADPTLLTALMKRFFTKPEKLVGKTLEITLGYKGSFLQYLEGKGEDAVYAIMNNDGTLLDCGPYTKTQAVIAAAQQKTQITELELLNITSKIVDEPETEEAAKPKTEEEGW